MKRKVNRVGQNTLTVSLPSSWVKKQGIKYGDELEVEDTGNEIIFSKNLIKKAGKEIILNIDNMTYFELSRYLTLLYRNNFSKIILTYNKKELYDPKKKNSFPITGTINRIINRLIGGEIISQTSTKTIIECFTSDETQDLDKIEKRIFFLLREMMEQLCLHIGEKSMNFEAFLYNHHDNIAKFTNYFLRELNFSDLPEELKKEAYSFHLILDKVSDMIRHLGEKIDEYGCSPKVKELIHELFNFFYLQCEMIYKFSSFNDVVKKRYDLFHKIRSEKFNVNELQVVSELDFFINIINNFSEYVIIKELCKNGEINNI